MSERVSGPDAQELEGVVVGQRVLLNVHDRIRVPGYDPAWYTSQASLGQ